MDAKVLTLKFNPQWILEHQSGGTSNVVPKSIEIISKQFSIDNSWIISSAFHQCKVLFAADKIPQIEEILSTLKESIDLVDEKTDLKVELSDIDEKEIKELVEKKEISLKDADIMLFKTKLNMDLTSVVNQSPKTSATESPGHNSEEENKPKVQPETHIEKNIDVETLIGLNPLKKWVKETEAIKDQYLEFAKKTEIVDNISYLISINHGCGLSTIVKFMMQTLEKTQLANFGNCKNFWEHKLVYNDDKNKFDSYTTVAEAVSRFSARTRENEKYFCIIHLDDWIDKIYDKRIGALIYLFTNHKSVIPIFAIPYVEDVVVKRVYDRLNDILSVRMMKFAPPSGSDYFQYFKSLTEKYGMSINDDVKESFVSRIASEKNDGKFYGFNTVEKVTNEFIYNLLIDSSQNNIDIPTEISKEIFKKICIGEEENSHTGLEQLNEMVALKEVKEKVQEIISTIKLQKKLFLQDSGNKRPCLHMMFTGNPGTGKTVIARIIGKIFKEEGILSVGNFYEVTRQDLVGQYVGQTAPKTMEICRSAYGSVLFIDEAYMLANDRETYGAEAIGTLISEMENNRDNMVVIFAGYANELEKLFEINSGLKDRIPYIINFPNYSRKELEEIFFKQFPKNIKYDTSFTTAADEFFDSMPDSVMNSKEFSNGRFVRNLSEKIISKAALRYEMSADEIEDFKITESDFKAVTEEQNLSKLSEKEYKRIGF